MTDTIYILCITLLMIISWISSYIERGKTKFYKNMSDVFISLLDLNHVKAYCEDLYGPGSVESIAIYQFCINLLEQAKEGIKEE